MNTVLVTGAGGLCGAAIRELSTSNLSFHYTGKRAVAPANTSHYIQADLRVPEQVRKVFEATRPDMVIHAAARVGGIGANIRAPGEFFRDNILMNTLVIDAAREYNVSKLIVFSSVCVYSPDISPLTEDKMHVGEPYPAHQFYGHSKRACDIMIRAYKKQFGFKNWMSMIPGNIFGKNDNYDLVNSHIIAALIHKLYLAKRDNTDFIVWGTGVPTREFVYVDDLARILIDLLRMDQVPERLIVSGEQEFAIKDVVDLLLKVSEFRGKVVWDTSKPDGQRNRPSDKTLFRSLFPGFRFTDFETALRLSWDWFSSNYPNVRM